MDLAVLMPVKAFAEAKQRLATVLTGEQRVQLASWMAERVLLAAREVPVYIVCDAEQVRGWAEERGAHVLWTAERGLNGAVDDGVRAVEQAGFDHVVVAHADLPLPDGLLDVARQHTATFVPDRRRDGTNVMSFPLNDPITASYGIGSFRRHWSAAARLAREVRIDSRLSIDVDTAADLSHPLLSEVLPEWLPTIPANRYIHP